MPEKVVLAYSGGLDTSIIIPWLKENYSYDVIAMVGDVGQGDDIEAVVEKAHKTGASKVVVEDLREEFLTGYVFPALKAGAVYAHKYLLGTSLARPVIAKHQVEVALREGATALAHGCTGKGNDQVRFELAHQALAPALQIMAPWTWCQTALLVSRRADVMRLPAELCSSRRIASLRLCAWSAKWHTLSSTLR